jgi:histidinol-phosphate/aromatic aminotransferase/cobyric acid decarboxylase-like protein
VCACLDVSKYFIERTRALIASERRYIRDASTPLEKVRVFPSSANFIMVKVAGEQTAGEFARHLRGRGIVARDLSLLPGCGSGFYRFGLRTRPDNIRLIEAVADY